MVKLTYAKVNLLSRMREDRSAAGVQRVLRQRHPTHRVDHLCRVGMHICVYESSGEVMPIIFGALKLAENRPPSAEAIFVN